jgi:polyhydroxyalkanoate synthesis regulator phasin
MNISDKELWLESWISYTDDMLSTFKRDSKDMEALLKTREQQVRAILEDISAFYKKSYEEAKKDADKQAVNVSRLETKIERLEKAIIKHGGHTEECEIRPCTCGLVEFAPEN